MPSLILTHVDHLTLKEIFTFLGPRMVSFGSHVIVIAITSGLGEDSYDIIEHGAKYEWCNGSVGMAGNSWLGISQYWAAMQQPPHLKAIAPWEGYSDLYRDMMRRGGIPWAPFLKWVLLGVPGMFALLQHQHP